MLPVAPTIRTVCILVCGGGDGLRYGWASACWLNSGVRYPKKKKKKTSSLSCCCCCVTQVFVRASAF